MTLDFTIRVARPEDAEKISNLIIRVAEAQLRNEFTPEGWELFLRLISRQTQQGLIEDHQFQYWIACLPANSNDETLIGLLCCKQINHLFHFFILPEYQRRGVGKSLWRHYLYQLPSNSAPVVTVKSSDFACNFYLKLGFQIVQPRRIENGLVYTLMQFTRHSV